MLEIKDMAIKLFGKTIPLSQNKEIQPTAGDSGGTAGGVEQDCVVLQEKELSKEVEKEQAEQKDNPLSSIPSDTTENEEEKEEEEEAEAVNVISEEIKKDPVPSSAAIVNENPKTPSVEKETSTLKTSKIEEENSDTSVSQEKALKKPDKILPCPRCNSMDTKFCYYNNYNVNQPRHFCKNCQRYWTAGGTMRNVPVGAGRRKNKNTTSHYRHITVSEALQTARASVAPDVVHHAGLRQGGTVLTFGADTPLCESMASVLKIAEKSKNGTRNGFHRPEQLQIPDSGGGGGGNNGDETSSNKPSTGASNPTKPHVLPQNCNGFPPQIPCFPGAPWPAYPWNSSQWSSSVPAPAFCASSFPIPFYHAAAYWGCAVPGPWTFPWPTTTPSSLSSNTAAAPGSGPNSPLGKHSREGDMLKPCNSEKREERKESESERCLWIPKTLRIDDPGEAARSSIWATLGINKSDKADSLTGGRLFKAFQSKGNEKTSPLVESSPVLQANPAAFSRSLNFQESS